MPNTHSSYKTDSEILKKLFELAREKYHRPSHYMTDSSVQHDDMCEELEWYEEHFENMADLLVLLEKFYPQNPSKRVKN
jgi:predicted transcriptional regulator